MTDLGLNLLEGIQNRKGRSIFRRNPRAAVTWFRQAANRGDQTAAFSLGYAYDVGLGTRRNVAQAVRWCRRASRSGDSGAASNLAIVYRDAGKAGLAFQWWTRAANMKDGDAAVDVGYSYQYGIGARKNLAHAKRMFRSAIASIDISQYSREEALYHLAIQLIDEGKRNLAVPLLKRATADDDYPAAASVLDQLEMNFSYAPCRCRRFIDKNLRGHAKCPLHSG